MEYFSPFNLPGLQDIENFDGSKVKQAKRLVLAEFELNNNENIVLDGQEISKDQALKILEGLNDEKIANYHFEIKKQKDLLDFLERSIIPANPSYQNNEKMNEDGFLKFVAPYFAFKYNKLISEAYSNENIPVLQNLSKLKILTTFEYQDECYKYVNRNVQNQIDAIDADCEVEKIITTPDEDLKKHFALNRLKSLNFLPDFFMDKRCDYAMTLIRLYVSIFNNKHKPALAKELISHLVALRTDEATREEIKKRVKEVERLTNNNYNSGGSNFSNTSSSSSSDSGNAWAIIRVVLILVVVIIRIATCNRHSSSSYDFNRNSYNFADLQKQIEASKALTEELNNSGESYGRSFISVYENFDLHPESEAAKEFKKQLAQSKGKSLENGKVLFNTTTLDDGYQTNGPQLEIVNKTGYDAILMVDGYPAYKKVLSAVYLKNGNKLSIPYVEYKKEKTRITLLLGKNWNKNMKVGVTNPILAAYSLQTSSVKDTIEGGFASPFRTNNQIFLYSESIYSIVETSNATHQTEKMKNNDSLTRKEMTAIVEELYNPKTTITLKKKNDEIIVEY